MSDEIIISYCSPTLANLKIGNIFSYKCSSISLLKKQLDSYNKLLNSKSIFLTLLNFKDDNALIYMFRSQQLERYLLSFEVQSFMKKYGYSSGSIYHYIKKLSYKLRFNNEFPHEIGLFLGYPLEDVKCFITNHGLHCKYLGTWKVYHNLDDALKTFDSYKKCTKVYKNKLKNGFSLESLVTSI